MDIQMAGIDHNTAGVKIRECFSFTVSQTERALQEIHKQPGVRGCVLLSTCNRMELYVSAAPAEVSMEALLEKILPVPFADLSYRQYFIERAGEEAVRHLFSLTAGFQSRIVGEGQILTQVKDALKRARELYCTDTLLEVLFRQAVTAGKEVRAKELFTHTDSSAVHCAVARLKAQGYPLRGKKCLVIGNGQMGKLAAEALTDEGASVTVTVRQYRSGMVEIPKGCSRIDYGERYRLIPFCDLILSATVSPNLTIRKEPFAQARKGNCRTQILIDLAVPRDMEEEVAQLEGVTLYDIDAFQSGWKADQTNGLQAEAAHFLAVKTAEFTDWYACRDLVPRIQQIGRRAAEEICWRMGRGLDQLPKQEQERVTRMLDESTQKVIDKMLYHLRDGLEREELHHCIEVLEKIRYG